MASKYLDMCPPVLASLKAGTPIIAIETGFFMQLPYPRNLEALQECEQAFYRRDCVPCCVGIVNGRLKAGLSKQDMDTLCRSGGSCTRSQIPALVGGGSTSGTGPSATLAIARMAGIIPVMAPGSIPRGFFVHTCRSSPSFFLIIAWSYDKCMNNPGIFLGIAFFALLRYDN